MSDPVNRIVTLRLGGPLIEISRDGSEPLSERELFDVTQKFSFNKLNFNYGYKSYKNKSYSPLSSERVILYQHDLVGRLICNKGWFDWLFNYFEKHNYQINLIDERVATSDLDYYNEDWERVLDNFEFRPNQEKCLIAIAARVRDGLGGLIDAVPAFGKTAIITMLTLLYPKAKIDIITTGSELVEDIYKSIIKYNSDVGQCGLGQSIQDRITVYSSGSMHYSNFDADLVFADEVHLLMTEKRRKYLAQYMKALLFGFTGTAAHRLDNAHVCIEALCGPTIFKLGWDQATEAGLVSPIEVYWQKVELDENPVANVDDVVTRKRYGIWRNDDRNRIIADVSRELYNKGLQTLILVETVEHALRLKQLLPEFEAVYSENSDNTKFDKAGLTDGLPQMTKKRRKSLKKDFESRKLMGVIANSVWATGVSFDSLEVLVRADSSSSPTVNIQWSGRVARIYEGKTHGILIDFEDNFDETLNAKAVRRRNIYKKNGWKQLLPGGEVFT